MLAESHHTCRPCRPRMLQKRWQGCVFMLAFLLCNASGTCCCHPVQIFTAFLVAPGSFLAWSLFFFFPSSPKKGFLSVAKILYFTKKRERERGLHATNVEDCKGPFFHKLLLLERLGYACAFAPFFHALS